MAVGSKLRNQLTWIVEHWPILGVLVFVGVYIFFSGYFYILTGVSTPPLSIPDISLSAIALAGTILASYNIWTSLDNALVPKGFRGVLLIGVLLCILSGYQVYQLFQIGWKPHSWEFLYNALSILFIVLVATTFVLWHMHLKSGDNLESFHALPLILVVAAIIYVSGLTSGLLDLRNSKLAHLSSENGENDLNVLPLR